MYENDTTTDTAIEESEEIFAKKSPGRLFLRAALPGALGMLISSAYELVDGILVGNFLGETAFAAVNLAIPFIVVGFAVGDLVGAGSAVPISISLGKGDYEHANNVFSFACLLNIVSGAVLGLVLYLAAPGIMFLMGAEGTFAELATTYLRVYAFFLPITTNMYAVDNFLRISGHVRRSFVVSVIMAVTGSVLEFAFLGIFHMGIWSAALAYSLAMVLAIVIALWPFFQGRMLLKFTRPHFSPEMIAEIAKYGMPVFLETTSGRIFSILMNIALLRMGGETAVSVFGVIMFAQSIVVMLIYGTVDALQPAVGYNWGARSLGRVKALEKYCFAASAVFGLLGFAYLQLFPEQLTSIFLPGADEAFMELSCHALRLYSFAFLLKWFSFASQSFMIAVGQVRLASFISVTMAFIFPTVALGVLLPLGLDGLWLNSLATHVLCSIGCAVVLLRFRRTVHERLDRA